jgi:hypothetical protein
MELAHLAMICLTAAFIAGVILYVVYLIVALNKGVIKDLTPSDRTYRLFFLISIILVVTYLILVFGGDLHSGVLPFLGTIAGYMLGGEGLFHKPKGINGPSNKDVKDDDLTAQ